MTPTPTPTAELSDAAIAQAFREAVQADIAAGYPNNDYASIEYRAAEIEATRELPASAPKAEGDYPYPTHLPGWGYWRVPETGVVTIMLPQKDLEAYVDIALATTLTRQLPAAPSSAGEGECNRDCDCKMSSNYK